MKIWQKNDFLPFLVFLNFGQNCPHIFEHVQNSKKTSVVTPVANAWPLCGTSSVKHKNKTSRFHEKQLAKWFPLFMVSINSLDYGTKDCENLIYSCEI